MSIGRYTGVQPLAHIATLLKSLFLQFLDRLGDVSSAQFAAQMPAGSSDLHSITCPNETIFSPEQQENKSGFLFCHLI